eukprot:GHVO01058179.1.p1 GENE.GHVO01058179.1~~GHVO01058179.1.p1  ORF type:complete len:257 (+),score=28.03 GHVO01058179.1:613-1383(+)
MVPRRCTCKKWWCQLPLAEVLQLNSRPKERSLAPLWKELSLVHPSKLLPDESVDCEHRHFLMYSQLYCHVPVTMELCGYICEGIARMEESPVKVLEVGSGLGLIAHLLKGMHGVDIIATDIFDTSKDLSFDDSAPCYTEVEKACAQTAITTHTSEDRCVLMMVWPLPSVAAEAVSKFAEFGGKHILYIGESDGDGTGGKGFIDVLEDHHFRESYERTIPTWPRIHRMPVIRVYSSMKEKESCSHSTDEFLEQEHSR